MLKEDIREELVFIQHELDHSANIIKKEDNKAVHVYLAKVRHELLKERAWLLALLK